MIQALDRRRRVTAVPYQAPGIPERYGLTRAQCETAAWAFTEDGKRVAGAEAVNVALSAALGNPFLLWIYRLPGVRWLQDRFYEWVSRNRRLFRGVTPYCKSYPQGCEPELETPGCTII
jgi:predicted DCC family thiol-disulfide oxidoreductase YuxK